MKGMGSMGQGGRERCVEKHRHGWLKVKSRSCLGLPLGQAALRPPPTPDTHRLLCSEYKNQVFPDCSRSDSCILPVSAQQHPPPRCPVAAASQAPCSHLVCLQRKVWMGKGMPRPLSCSWPSELFLFTMVPQRQPGSPPAPIPPQLLSPPSPQPASPPCSPPVQNGCRRQAGDPGGSEDVRVLQLPSPAPAPSPVQHLPPRTAPAGRSGGTARQTSRTAGGGTTGKNGTKTAQNRHKTSINSTAATRARCPEHPRLPPFCTFPPTPSLKS